MILSILGGLGGVSLFSVVYYKYYKYQLDKLWFKNYLNICGLKVEALRTLKFEELSEKDEEQVLKYLDDLDDYLNDYYNKNIDRLYNQK